MMGTGTAAGSGYYERVATLKTRYDAGRFLSMSGLFRRAASSRQGGGRAPSCPLAAVVGVLGLGGGNSGRHPLQPKEQITPWQCETGSQVATRLLLPQCRGHLMMRPGKAAGRGSGQTEAAADTR
jgi:hypothetical protein